MPRTSVAIPLYIYPAVDEWTPLFQAIAAFPHAHFNIIVNPNNGPGGIVPDSNYIKEVARLNNFRNVATFGYVHVSWAKRDLQLVKKDVKDWSCWRDFTQADIHVDGIFVDEAPSDPSTVSYMAELYQQIKQDIGREAAVWTNPGIDIDEAFYEHADMVNSHENTHAAWLGRFDMQTNPKSTTMIHSYEGSSTNQASDIARLAEQGYMSILITTEKCYTSFSKYLDDMVQTIGSLP